jgi:hypothetical protein
MRAKTRLSRPSKAALVPARQGRGSFACPATLEAGDGRSDVERWQGRRRRLAGAAGLRAELLLVA